MPAAVHRDLVSCAQVLGGTTGRPVPEPSRLIVPMIERFVATDRAFAKARRDRTAQAKHQTQITKLYVHAVHIVGLHTRRRLL